jgi:hypothetical protein
VHVIASNLPSWLSDEFQLLLGKNRTVNAIDQTALIELSAFPDHIVQQALNAAREWLRRPNQKPIHSLARWLVGTAQRKWEAEQQRGSTVSSLANERRYALEDSMGTWEEDADLPDQIPKPDLRTPQAQIWHTVLQELAAQMPKATYDAWLSNTVVVAATDDEYEIGLANAQAKDWLENRLGHTIKRILTSLLGHPVTVSFQVVR